MTAPSDLPDWMRDLLADMEREGFDTTTSRSVSMEEASRSLQAIDYHTRSIELLEERARKQIDRLRRKIDWHRSRVESWAIEERQSTGESTIPLHSHLVSVRRPPSKGQIMTTDRHALAVWVAESRPPDVFPELYRPTFDVSKFKSGLKWSVPGPDGTSEPRTADGEPVPGLLRKVPQDGEFRVSWKPRAKED